MHELSLLDNVRTILEEHARSQQFEIVDKITIEIGALSCIESEALRFAFDTVMNNSLAQHAQLTIKHIAGQGRCVACGKMTPMRELYDTCPHCGHFQLDILSGLEMKITELEVR